MSKTATARNGQKTESVSVKKLTGKSAAEKAMIALKTKIEAASSLQSKVKARTLFQLKLDEINDAKSELGRDEVDQWEDNHKFRVSMGNKHHNTPILSFNKPIIIHEFLDFMKASLEKKLSELDKEILEFKV